MHMEIQDKFVIFTNPNESFWEYWFAQNYITNMINKYHEDIEQKKIAHIMLHLVVVIVSNIKSLIVTTLIY
jgi:hypothetical protein